LNHQAVIFTCFDYSAVFTHQGTIPFVYTFYQIVTSRFHNQRVPGVPRTGSRRRSQNFDFNIRQIRVDLTPLLGLRAFFRHRLPDLVRREINPGCFYTVGKCNTVITNNNFENIGNAVFLAQLPLGVFHRPRCIGNVWMLFTDARAEQLHSAAGSCAFNNRRLEALVAHFLCDHGRKRIDS